MGSSWRLQAKELTIATPDPTASTVGRVLAVDDQRSFRSVLRRVVDATATLAPIGEAESGEDAVALVEELEPDVVLMDVRMPGMGGIEAARRIKELRPETVVLLVSTTPAEHLAAAIDDSGADAFVSKGELRPHLLDELWRRRAP
jgi:DNA-binding NarL/FixJ family response regulator